MLYHIFREIQVIKTILCKIVTLETIANKDLIRLQKYIFHTKLKQLNNKN